MGGNRSLVGMSTFQIGTAAVQRGLAGLAPNNLAHCIAGSQFLAVHIVTIFADSVSHLQQAGV
jgi:hypothetical protein